MEQTPIQRARKAYHDKRISEGKCSTCHVREPERFGLKTCNACLEKRKQPHGKRE